MSYRVKTVAAMTGIARPTLLAWERRYEIVEPRRSESGYRIYTDEDVALLRQLKGLVDAGHPIGEAVMLARAADEAAVPAQPVDAVGLQERLIASLLRYDRAAVDRMEPELAQLTFARLIDDVLLPLLQRTGDEWAGGRVSVAQEHQISAWCRERMMTIFHALGAGPVNGPKVVCATAPGELHELGLLGVALKLALAGWRVTWLGADLPIPELVEAVRANRPRLVCLSIMETSLRDQVLGYANALRDAVPEHTLVAVGGRATIGLESASKAGMLVTPSFAMLQAALADAGIAS